MLVAAFNMLLFTDVRHLCEPSLLGSLEMKFYWGRALACECSDGSDLRD